MAYGRKKEICENDKLGSISKALKDVWYMFQILTKIHKKETYSHGPIFSNFVFYDL